MSKTVSIIIPTADKNSQSIKKCLSNIEENTHYLEYNIEIIEDSGKYFKFSKSINRGIRKNKDSEYYVLLNDDCYVEENWLRELIEPTKKNDDVGIVGAKLFYPDGSIQHSGGEIRKKGMVELIKQIIGSKALFWGIRKMSFIIEHKKGYPAGFLLKDNFEGEREVDFVGGAMVLIPKITIEKIGLYDQGYIMGCEDIDYSLRCWEAGLKVICKSSAQAIHNEGKTIKEESVPDKPLYGWKKEMGQMLFIKRWNNNLPSNLPSDR